VRPENKMAEVMNCRRVRAGGGGEEEEEDDDDYSDDDEYNALLTVRTPCVCSLRTEFLAGYYTE
jgi:hypothetical protein